MRSLLTIGSLVLGTAACGTQALAQYDEHRIRNSESETVIQAHGGVITFSISGVGTDFIYSPFYTGPLSGAPWYTRGQNSNGEYTYRFSVTIQQWMGGGILYLYRGSVMLDGDRILWG